MFCVGVRTGRQPSSIVRTSSQVVLVKVVVELKDLTMAHHLAVPLIQTSGPTWAPSRLVLRPRLVGWWWHVLNADMRVQLYLLGSTSTLDTNRCIPVEVIDVDHTKGGWRSCLSSQAVGA